eukprot:127642_1
MVPLLTTILIFALAIKGQDIEWFKNSSIHRNNIQQLIDGWKQCPDWNPASTSLFNLTSLCIDIQVPLKWDIKNMINVSTINYHIARVFSGFDTNNTKRKGAFWMLHGGPGFSGTHLFAGSHAYAKVIPLMNFLDDTHDIYIPDHRGTGYSNRLECGIHNPAYLTIPFSDIKACSEYLNTTYRDDTLYFSTYSASMDLGYVVDLFQTDLSFYNNNNDIIFGFSYGTYYLNQYLNLFPDQFNASIFDSMCPPDICRLSAINNGSNLAGLDFLARCNNNEFCKKRFETINITIFDATKEIFSLLQLWEAGLIKPTDQENKEQLSCLISFNGTTAASQLRTLLFSWLADTDLRVLIPPFLYRMYRCIHHNNEDDKNILNHLFTTLNAFNQTATQILANSTAQFMAEGLMLNVMLSELWDGTDPTDPGPSVQELTVAENSYFFSGGGVDGFRNGWNIWNKYTPKPALYNKFANVSIPMLLLHGDLDPVTGISFGLHAANEWGMSMNVVENNNNRYFYALPTGLHGFLLSRIKNYTDFTIELDTDWETCGMYIIKSFIDTNNGYVPDASCIAWISDIDWNVTSNVSKQLGLQYFGTSDVWGMQLVDTHTPSMDPTISPSKSPSVYPTELTTKSPGVYPTEPPAMSEFERTWYITGIVFICLFGVALIVIFYLLYLYRGTLSPNVGDSGGKYRKTQNEDIEAATLKTYD